MVPWHPPCALISLIFSSLDPETNCLFYLRMEAFLLHRFVWFVASVPLVPSLRSITYYSVLQLAFILNHSLCSCQGAVSSCRFRPSCVRCSVANPESDTDFKRISQQLPMRRCASLLTFLLGIQLAQQLCCHALSTLFGGLWTIGCFFISDSSAIVSTIG